MYPRVVCLRRDHHFDNPNEHISCMNASSGINPSIPGTQQDKLALQALREGIHQLDDLINRLHDEKADLLRSINSLKASTRRLPPEVLSAIFQYARPPIDFGAPERVAKVPANGFEQRESLFPEDDFQLVLGAVSSHWRQVAWSTPQLWTTLSMGPHPSVHVSNDALLSLYFQNSRYLPMTIELDLQALSSLVHEMPEAIHHLDYFRTRIFIAKSEKIRNLILIGAPPQWIPLIGKRLVNCEALTLRWPGKRDLDWGHRYAPSLDHLPRLRYLQLEGLSIRPTLSWSTITTLQLDRMSHKSCIHLLARCPNLVQFENRNPSRDFEEDLPFREPILHEHLELLKWHEIEGPCTSAFLECARFTKLRRLTWNADYGDPCPTCGTTGSQCKFPIFLSNLPITFEVFEFASFKVSYPHWDALLYFKDLFQSFDRLPQLQINLGGVEYSHRLLDMIGRPVTESSNGYRREIIIGPKDSRGPKLLSGLESLVLDNQEDVNLDTVVEMLEALETTAGRFHLELTKKVTWGVKAIERILGLLDRGFELEVVEEGVLLDFMPKSPYLDSQDSESDNSFDGL